MADDIGWPGASFLLLVSLIGVGLSFWMGWTGELAIGFFGIIGCGLLATPFADKAIDSYNRRHR